MTKQIFLASSDNSITITDKNECLEKNHIRALRAYGFYKESTDYICVHNAPNTDMVVDVSQYLQTHGYEIAHDRITAQKINRLATIKSEYSQAKNDGLKIKKLEHIKPIFPPDFNPKVSIKSYQQKCIQHMLKAIHAANFSVPGSGKTLMTYAVYNILKQQDIVDSMLVVGPLPSFGPWEHEYEFCTGRNPRDHILRYHGVDRKKYLSSLVNYNIILTSYATATNDTSYLTQHLMSKKKIMMVVDESHHIKNIDKEATQANAIISLGKHAERRYILSGTPVPHSFEDLWSQVTFLWPVINILKTRNAYKHMLENYGAHSEIAKRIEFLWTRITNKQLEEDMPRILPHESIFVPMSGAQETIYTAIERDMWYIDHSDLIHNNFQLRRNRILRLMQAVTNPGTLRLNDELYGLRKFQSSDSDLNSSIEDYDEVSPKIAKAAKLASKIAKHGENVVVWTVFVKNMEMLCDEIRRLEPDSDPIGISGDVPVHPTAQSDIVGREKLITEFKKSSGRILVATMGSIAESISLHKTCHQAIYLERSFNAGQYMQSLSRIYRIGSDKTKPVKFYYLHSVFSDGITETIDSRIDGVLKDRIKNMHELLNDEFKLHPLEMETTSQGDRDDEVQILYDDITALIQKHKDASKI